MAGPITTDLCVIGAGSGGLAVAAGAVQMGAEVVLIEKGKMGGDCLNYGCVPSKALIAAGKAAQTIRSAGRFGVNGHEPAIDFPAVHAHVHGVIAAIAPHDSEERFAGLGVKVLRAPARFTGPREVEVAGQRVRARRFVIATGSSPAIPPVPGLAEAPHLTNETIFDLTERPEHLIVLGGGPIGCELAQAQRRLGARVTVLELFAILPKDDPAAVEVVRRRLLEEGHRPARAGPGGRRRARRQRRRGDDQAGGSRGADRRQPSPGGGRPAGERRGPRPRGRGRRVQPQGHRGRCPAAHQQQADLCDRRRRGRLPVHPHGRLSRRDRDPERAVQAAGQGRHARGALGHLHRARARPGRPDRGDGQGAGRRGPGPDLAVRRERPRPGRARDRWASSRCCSIAAAASGARRSSASAPAS